MQADVAFFFIEKRHAARGDEQQHRTVGNDGENIAPALADAQDSPAKHVHEENRHQQRYARQRNLDRTDVIGAPE